MKIIVYLTGTSLTTNGPFVDQPGASGAAYMYEWSAKHGKHILHGREMTLSDLDELALDVFTAESGYRFPVPKLIAESSDEFPVLTQAFGSTPDELFEQCTALLKAPTDRVKLGMKLVNANREPSRKKERQGCEKEKAE